MITAPSRHRAATALLLGSFVAILTVGLGFRVHCADYALPYVLDVDEPDFVDKALEVASGSFDMGGYGCPASTMKLVLGAVYRVWFLVDRSWGRTRSFEEWRRADRAGRRSTVLVGRAVCALVDLLTVGLVFLLAFRLGAPVPVCLLASLFYACSGLAIDMSHRVRGDGFSSLFWVGSTLASLEILARGLVRDYVRAGVLAGLAFASRWPAGLSLVSGFLSHLLSSPVPRVERSRRQVWSVALLLSAVAISMVLTGSYWEPSGISDEPGMEAPRATVLAGLPFLRSNLLIGGMALLVAALLIPLWTSWSRWALGLVLDPRVLCSLAAFGLVQIVSTPSLISRFSWFVNAALVAMYGHHPPAEAQPGLGNLLYYISHPLLEDLGVLALILAAIGLASVLGRDPRSFAVVFASPCLYLCYVSLGSTTKDFWMLPLSPFLALAASHGIGTLLSSVPDRRVVVLLGALLVIPSVTGGVERARRYGRTFTQVAASRWFDANVPPYKGIRVVTEQQGILISPARYVVFPIYSIGMEDPVKFDPRLVDYVVLTEYMYGRFLERADRYRTEAARYRKILESWRPVAVFDGRAPGMSGQDIRIYRVDSPGPIRPRR